MVWQNEFYWLKKNWSLAMMDIASTFNNYFNRTTDSLEIPNWNGDFISIYNDPIIYSLNNISTILALIQ